MRNKAQLWDRSDAERRVVEILQGAKSGRLQLITDSDGVFEVRFKPAHSSERAGDFLARGGPADD